MHGFGRPASRKEPGGVIARTDEHFVLVILEGLVERFQGPIDDRLTVEPVEGEGPAEYAVADKDAGAVYWVPTGYGLASRQEASLDPEAELERVRAFLREKGVWPPAS